VAVGVAFSTGFPSWTPIAVGIVHPGRLCDLQAETLQPERLKEVTAPQLKEYEIRRDRIRQLCAQLEKIGRG
jgi:hypothetical protein